MRPSSSPPATRRPSELSPASAWSAHPAREGTRARGGTFSLGLLLAALAAYLLAPSVGEWSGAARWRYVGASTAPGAVVREAPAAVTVRLSDSVAAWSRLDVSAAVTTADGFTVWENAAAAAGRDSTDPTHRTLAATLRPVSGARHYRVEWTAYDPRGGAGGRWGGFYFGVGAPVPSALTERLGGGVVRDERVETKHSRQLRALATVLLFIVGAGAVRQWLGGDAAAPGVRRGGLLVADLPALGARAYDARPPVAARETGPGTALRLLVLALVVAAFGACAAVGSLLLAPFRGFGGG